MSYESKSIRDTIDELNRTYFLPAIQREFVWEPERIERLFDSIMGDYPIGSFLFWKVKEENKNDWTCYIFIHNYDEEHPHNDVEEHAGSPPPTTQSPTRQQDGEGLPRYGHSGEGQVEGDLGTQRGQEAEPHHQDRVPQDLGYVERCY